MPENKQPIMFARTIIYELAQIRATVQLLSDSVLNDAAERKQLDKKVLRAAFQAELDAKVRKLYNHYSKVIGLEEPKPGTNRT
jgi:hypothetical protein